MVFQKTHDRLGVSILDVIIHAFPDVKSKTKAREFVKSGAFRINDEKVTDETSRLVSYNGYIFLVKDSDITQR